MPQFAVTDPTTDKTLGIVEADDYISAAVTAADRFFNKQSARRVDGWAGHPGVFDAFNLQEEDTTPFHLRQL